MAPEFINVSYYLFTPDDKQRAQNLVYNLSEKQLKESRFNPKLRTVIMTHGFKSGLEEYLFVRPIH